METRQYLTFSLAGEHFAVGTLSVKEIIEYGQLTGVPMMPPSIRGVINLRGAVVPVTDLGARFGGRRTEVGRRTSFTASTTLSLRDYEKTPAYCEIA